MMPTPCLTEPSFVSVLKKDTEMPSWRQVLRHNSWLVTAQGIADLGVQRVKRHGGVCLAGQYQQWMHILLRTALCPLGGVLCDQDHCSHVRGLAVCIRLHGWRQKCCVWIPVFIATAWGRRADVWGHALGNHGHPLTPQVVITVSGE